MNTEVPKQYLLLAGKTGAHVFHFGFSAGCSGNQDRSGCTQWSAGTWTDLCEQHRFNEPHTVVVGGNTGISQSGTVWIRYGHGFVAVHDGVRPLIRPDTIRRLFAEAAVHSNAIPAFFQVTPSAGRITGETG